MQNYKNFTTIEQGKMLLRLGVPENSADCCWAIPESGSSKTPKIGVIPNDAIYEDIVNLSKDAHRECYPCWSVGRLMEIFRTCANIDIFSSFDFLGEPIERAMKAIDFIYNTGIQDFSKWK